jgi:hypothetical protein
MVYIRDVDEGSHEKMPAIAGEFEKLGVEVMFITDTIEAALHAVSKGWILEEDIADIVVENDEEDDNKGS